MRSPAVALVWEYWRFGRWTLAQFLGVMLGMPALIYGVLTFEGVDAVNRRPLGMYLSLTLVSLAAAVAAAVISVGKPERLYRLPLSADFIVACRLFPATTVALAMYLTTAVLVNDLFAAGWPLWGPALFFAAATAAVVACVWGFWRWCLAQIAASTAVAVAMGCWANVRLGGGWWFGEPQRYWETLTGGEALTLIVVIVIAYRAMVWGFAKNRQEAVPQRWLPANFEWAVRPHLAPFRSPLRAQFWFEWRQKGLAMPVVAVVLFFAGAAIVLPARYLSPPPGISVYFASELVAAAFGYALLFPLFASFVMGVFIGNSGRRQLGGFLATRPVSTSFLANNVLAVAAVSLLLTWAVCGLLLAAAHVASVAAFGEEGGLQLALAVPDLTALILGCGLATWALLGLTSSTGLTGRAWMVASPSWLIAGGATSFAALQHYVIPEPWEATVNTASLWTVGAGSALFTVWAYTKAIRLRLNSVGWAAAAFLGWAAACGLLLAYWRTSPEPHPLIGAYVPGLLTLPFAPWATASLALSWNRCR